MIALLYVFAWLGLWVTLIGGFFVPPLWVYTVVCVATVCVLPIGGERRETVNRELTLGQSAIRGLSPMLIVLAAIMLLKFL